MTGLWGLSWETLGAIGGLVALVGTGANTVATQFVPWFRAKTNAKSMRQHLGAEEYSRRTLEDSLRYYVEPLCSQVDPAGREDFRSVLPFSASLFSTLDKALEADVQPTYLILLADSGMGKTSALINYYMRNLRRWRRSTTIALYYLGSADVAQRIAETQQKSNTVLFLDALDEDLHAIRDSGARIQELLLLAKDFRGVLISCRSQFFAKDEEITSKTGILKVGPRAAGESAMYELQKVYLVPFTSLQIRSFLRKRYGLFQRHARGRAEAVIRQVGDLSARPMLLSYIDDLVQRKETLHRVTDAYSRIVAAWLKREEGHVGNIHALRAFSERLAVKLYLERDTWGGEHAPRDEISRVAKEWGIDLDQWKLTGRSLLNRDAQGNFKFSHRSILEFLFVQRFFAGEIVCLRVKWTDQMQIFVLDRVFESQNITYFRQAIASLGGDSLIAKKTVIGLISTHLNWYQWPSSFPDFHHLLHLIHSLRPGPQHPIEHVLVLIDILLFGTTVQPRVISCTLVSRHAGVEPVLYTCRLVFGEKTLQRERHTLRSDEQPDIVSARVRVGERGRIECQIRPQVVEHCDDESRHLSFSIPLLKRNIPIVQFTVRCALEFPVRPSVEELHDALAPNHG